LEAGAEVNATDKEGYVEGRRVREKGGERREGERSSSTGRKAVKEGRERRRRRKER
jgi:hypothetical protein